MRVLSIFIAIALLASCGVRPGAVKPPSGHDDGPFPATYPADTTLDGGRGE